MGREFLRFVQDVARRVVAVVAACLPARHWSRLDQHVPVTGSAGISGFVVLMLSVCLTIREYLVYASLQASQAIDTLLVATGWRPAAGGAARPAEAAATAQWVASWFSPLTFIVATPAGALLTYLTLSSLARCLAWAAGEPMGDPVLSGLDALWQKAARRWSARRELGRRERLEGAYEPDVVVAGSSLGHTTADLVVIAARRKPDWDAGVTVITSQGWYQVGTPVERSTSHGLRTLYPLTAVGGEVVLRRRVAYEFPGEPRGRAPQ